MIGEFSLENLGLLNPGERSRGDPVDHFDRMDSISCFRRLESGSLEELVVRDQGELRRSERGIFR